MVFLSIDLEIYVNHVYPLMIINKQLIDYI